MSHGPFLSSLANAAAWTTLRWLRTGLDFMLPPSCPWCGSPGGRADLKNWSPEFCRACTEQIAPEAGTLCDRCAAPIGPHINSHRGCVHCQADRFAFRSAVCLGVYRGALQTACLRAKNANGASIASALANLLSERAEQKLAGWPVDLVVPVPAHWSNRLLRDRHPATIIAEQIARRHGIAMARTALAKQRRTPSQGSLSPSERRNNLRRAFTASTAVAGRTVLLVDDVLTTGTTAHRCARALRASGAAAVYVAVVARGLGKPRMASSPKASDRSTSSLPSSMPGRDE